MTDYRPPLREEDVPPEPLELFRRWFAEAAPLAQREPHAVVLATATPDAAPSARMVLVREVDARRLAFYTNFTGRKALELAANPRGALLYYWDALQRQVRVEGPVVRLTEAESDAYFRTRHRESQVSAWVSPQSRVVEDRSGLEQAWQDFEREHQGREIPRPPFWGGFRLEPESWEFWQGRDFRLHDRLRYRRDGERWVLERLAP